MTVAAFFDIDGTIYRDSLMIENFRKLVKHEVIDDMVWYTDVKEVHDKWNKRHGDYDEYLETLAKVYIDNLVGVDVSYLNFIAEKTINDSFDNIYRYSRKRLAWHQEQGHKIFFISGSPSFLVSRMAGKYGVTEFRGTEYHVDENNRFTGEIDKMWDSKSKYNVVLELCSKYDINLEESFAYGDTNGDYSMLKLVGKPIAINPNHELLTAIKGDEELMEKATVVVERKDNIYILDPSVKTFETI